MTKIIFLPHPVYCPQGAEIDATPGETILDAALRCGIEIEHACEKSCACTTCHVIIRQGFTTLKPLQEQEEDVLDKAWGLTLHSRLSCQARVAQAEIWVEIPRYTVHSVRE